MKLSPTEPHKRIAGSGVTSLVPQSKTNLPNIYSIFSVFCKILVILVTCFKFTVPFLYHLCKQIVPQKQKHPCYSCSRGPIHPSVKY